MRHKTSLFFIFITLFTTTSKVFAENLYEQGLMNSKHMKEFNIFERNTKIPPILVTQTTDTRYKIEKVNFRNNTAFSTEELTQIVTKEIGNKLSVDDMNSISDSIKTFYNKHGYNSSIVNLEAEDASKGSITFTIYEGPKRQIEEVFKDR